MTHQKISFLIIVIIIVFIVIYSRNLLHKASTKGYERGFH